MADRGFDATLESELSSETPNLGILAFLDWPGGAIHAWLTGTGSLSWNAQTWVGDAKYVSLSVLGADSVDKSDIGMEITLNYLDDDARNEIVTNDPVGSDAALYLAVINPATRAVTTAYQFFTGFIDRCEIEDAGDTGSITVRLASELARLQRPRFFLLSHAHQQYLFSGDLGMEFAARMDEPVIWGRKPLLPYVPGTPSVPPLTPPYPGYNDQYTFPVSGYGPPGG